MGSGSDSNPGTGGRAVVTHPYVRPYPDPLQVKAGEQVTTDPTRETEFAGWTWCVDGRGQGGWTPSAWLERRGNGWVVDRAYDAIELTVDVGDRVVVHLVESGFAWATTEDGRTGWVPVDHLQVEEP